MYTTNYHKDSVKKSGLWRISSDKSYLRRTLFHASIRPAEQFLNKNVSIRPGEQKILDKNLLLNHKKPAKMAEM